MDGKVYEVVLARANKNINSEEARVLRETGRIDVATMTKYIKVDVRRVQIPKEVLDGWLSSFAHLNFVTVSSDLMVVDGVLHELWYRSSDNLRLHFSYGDPFDGDDEKSHPVVRWMNRVKADVQKYARP
jgi:hypothetical protein